MCPSKQKALGLQLCVIQALSAVPEKQCWDFRVVAAFQPISPNPQQKRSLANHLQKESAQTGFLIGGHQNAQAFSGAEIAGLFELSKLKEWDVFPLFLVILT